MPNWIPLDISDASTTVTSRGGWVQGLTLVAGSDRATMELYDGDPDGTGTLVHTLEAAANATEDSEFGDSGMALPQGVYVLMSGTGAFGSITYRPGGA